MLKQPRIKSPSARHDAARLPTNSTVEIESKVRKSSALSDEPPADRNMEQKSGNLVLGGRVVFLSRSGLHRGYLKYVGRVQFAEGEWCGVELDKPEDGCHVGAVDNVEYFRCEESRGVFVERWKVCREGQEEEIKSADVQCIPPTTAKTLFSPESETRLPQLKFKSKIPSSLKSKTMKSSSSSTAMAPLRVTLDVNKSTEEQVHVRTFVDLRGGSDGEKVESTGQRIKETELVTSGSGGGGGVSSGDLGLQHHYSTVKTIRKSQSRSYRPAAVYQRMNDAETDGIIVGADGKGNIPLFLSDKENSGRSKRDQSGDDDVSTSTMTTNELTGEMEGFQSDNEDVHHSTGCCIQPFMSLYNHSLKDSNPAVARHASGISAKLPLCQGQSAAESEDGFSSVRSQSDRPVTTSAEDDSIGSKASMPDVIGPSAFLSKIPRMQKTDDDEEEEEGDEEEEDEFGDGDYLAASQTSLASSLGILNDSDILEDTCFFPEGFAGQPGHLKEQGGGQREQEGEGQREQEGEGQREQEGEGQLEQEGEGQREQEGEGQREQEGEGQREQEGEGQREQDGEGQLEQEGEGQREQEGEGQREQEGEGQLEQEGEGQREQEGEGQREQEGEGQREQEGEGQREQEGEGQREQEGEGQREQEGGGQQEQEGEGQLEQEGEGQREQEGEGQREQEGEGQREQEGEGQREQEGEGQLEQEGEGQREQEGEGQREQDGGGQREQDGEGQREQEGEGQREQEGEGQREQEGEGQREQEGEGQLEQEGEGQREQEGEGQREQEGEGQLEQEGEGQLEQEGEGQREQEGEGQREQEGEGQREQEGEGQREQEGEGQQEQESCLAVQVSSLNDSPPMVRESGDRPVEGVSRGCDDQQSTDEEIAVAAGVVSDDVERVEMEGHSTEEKPTNLAENHESVISSSFQLPSGEHLKAEVAESDLDVDNVQQTDMESCAENVLPIASLETSEENITTHDMETSDVTASEEEICVDAVENENAENAEDDDDDDVEEDDDDDNDGDNQRMSNIVVQVELERQLVDRQEHRLSYDDPSDVCNRLRQPGSCGKLDKEKSSSSHASSVAATPEKENFSAAFDKISKTPENEKSSAACDKASKTPEKESSSATFDKTSKTPEIENSAAFDKTSKTPEKENSSAAFGKTSKTPEKESSSATFDKTSKTPESENSSAAFDKTSKTPEKENASATFDKTSKTPEKENSSAAFDKTSKTPEKESPSAAFGETSKTPEKESPSAAFGETSKTPEKENSSATFDRTNKQSIRQDETHPEIEKTPGGVGDGGGSSMGSKAKLIKTIQISRPHLSTLEEKNEDPKRTPSNGNVEKAINRERKGEDKRQPPALKPRMALETGKPSVKGISGLHRNLGRVKSFDAPSQMPTIPSPRAAAPSVGDNAGVNRLRRTRVASLDLGNTSSSSSSSSLKRGVMRRETLWETKLHEPTTKERGVAERPQFGRTQTVTTAAAAKKRPSLLLHLNASFSGGKTYAVAKNNKTPSDSNLFSSATAVVSGSMLSRRTSTPLPSAEDPASCSSSMSLESSRTPGSHEKQQPVSVSANKKGLKNPSPAINSRLKTTNAGKSGQLKPKIGKKTEKIEKIVDVKTGSKQEQEWHQQQHHQPDLVPNRDAKDKEMAEIIRLEQLSEARLQQLNRLNAEVQCTTKWFQALVIVVQQLSQRLDSEDQNRNGLRCRLNESLEEIDSMRKQLQELMKQRDALVDEIQSVKEEEEQRREALKRDHHVQLNDMKDALQMQHDENLHRALNDHSRKIAVVEMNHQQQISELKKIHEEVVAENREDHMSSLNAQKSEHDNILQELKYQQDRQLNDITLRFEHIKLSLSEKVECLRSECEEMRRREATYMENCQAEMEQKLQQILMPYRHLPQEIESLKAVLDLRNLELHDLRHHNIQLQRQVEELPPAQETIKKFQQKVENLEAVVKIRADYERQLSEKHQQLLCRYDRESKANKRLSMDKEELLWRLSSSQTAEQLEASASSPSFDAFQRSLSHSLATANDCSGGSGGINSVVGPRSMSQTASSSSPSVFSASPMVSRMQRSGTYDLLCEVLDDEDTKGSRSSSSD